MEEATSTDNAERSKTLKQLAMERSVCMCACVKLLSGCNIKTSDFFCDAELSSTLDKELHDVRKTYNKLKKEYDQIQEKMKFFEKVRTLPRHA